MFPRMADYSSPKPVDPIWYQPHAWLRIHCGCGRREAFRLAEFARERCLPRETKLYELIAKLRCRSCLARPLAEVTRYQNGNRR